MTGSLLRAVAAALFALAPSVVVADETALHEAAKKEGKVVWYTTLIVNQVIIPIKQAFEKKYPGVTLEYARENEGPIAVKLLNESKAGRLQADVFDGLSIMAPLMREKLVAPYKPANAEKYPAALRDKDGHWQALLLFVFTPGVNTSMVKPQERPKSWDDLLDPRWRGKMAWNPSSLAGAVGFVGATLIDRGEEKGMDYLRKLAAQKVVNVEASSRAILDQVIAGEYPMGLMMFNHHTVISAAKGAPSDWVKMEPVPVALDAISLLKDAPHPNAAKLLIEFLSSAEGQAVIGRSNYLPALPGAPGMAQGLTPEDGKFRAVYLSPDIVDPRLPEWTKIVRDLFR